MRRAEGVERYPELGAGDVDVGCGTKQLVQDCPSLVVAASVVRAQERQEVALGLVREHLDEVRQMLAFGGELDDGTVADVTDLDSLGECAAAPPELGESVACGPKLLADLAVSDLEAAHGRAAALGVVHRCRAVGLLELGDFDAGAPDLLVEGASL